MEVIARAIFADTKGPDETLTKDTRDRIFGAIGTTLGGGGVCLARPSHGLVGVSSMELVINSVTWDMVKNELSLDQDQFSGEPHANARAELMVKMAKRMLHDNV